MAAISAGLEGVVAATTALSDVDGERGELLIGGFPIGEIAGHATFEETTWLLWHGGPPSRRALERFAAELAAERTLTGSTIALLRDCARRRVDPMDALRIGAGTMSLGSGDPRAIVARLPTIVATFWRFSRGLEPLEPRADLG